VVAVGVNADATAKTAIAAEDLLDALWFATLQSEMRRALSSKAVVSAADNEKQSAETADRTDAPNQDPEAPSDRDERKTQERLGLVPGFGGGSPNDGAIPLRVPGGEALPGALELARKLRPLKRRVPSRTRVYLDEAATARRIAEERVWIPVLYPAPARWLEAALLIDTNPSMRVWHKTAQELRTLLERQGAFRDVRVWTLDTANADSVALRTELGADRHIRELIDPAGRRLVLVVTDTMGSAWYSGAAAHQLVEWARMQPVALIQMLPEELWGQTALAGARRGQVRAPIPGFPTARLHFQPLSRASRRSRVTGLPMPILTLDPRYVALWAGMLAGRGGAWASGVLMPMTPITPPIKPSEDATPDQRIQVFQNIASRTAFELTQLLAAAPLFLPVMRLVQKVMLPASGQVHLAEFFSSELIRHDPILSETADPEQMQYEFLPGVREALLNQSRLPLIASVQDAVSKFIAERFGQSLDFQAYLRDPSQLPAVGVAESMRPFAIVMAEALRHFGQPYAEAVSAWRSTQPQLKPATGRQPDASNGATSGPIGVESPLQQGWATSVMVTPGAAPVLRRDLPANQPQLVVVPIDSSGTVRLNDELRQRLSLPPTLSQPSSGFYFAPGPYGATLAFLVTLAEPSEVRETIAVNLSGLLKTYQDRPYVRTWLPVMGREGGGLSRQESLDIILRAIGESGVTGRTDIYFVIATAPDIDALELIELRTRIEKAAGRPLHDVRGALSEAGITRPADAIVALFYRAAQLMLLQRPSHDNGRIKTRLPPLLALLETGSRQEPPSPAHALFQAWDTLAPGSFDRVMKRELPLLRTTVPEDSGAVIFSRDCAEALHIAVAKASDASVDLFHIGDALLEQAASRDAEQEKTGARRVLDGWNINPARLRDVFNSRLLQPPREAESPAHPGIHDWAVLVGVSRYREFPSLLYPERDAREFAEWIGSPTGGGVPRSQVVLLLSPGTVDEVNEAFLTVMKSVQQQRAGGWRRLYLCLLGHGVELPDGSQALLVGNASPVMLGAHVAGPAYADYFAASGYFQEVVLVMDCGREKMQILPLPPPLPPILAPNQSPTKQLTVYGPGIERSGASFMRTLVDGLRGGAAEPDGDITVVSLLRYLDRQGVRAFGENVAFRVNSERDWVLSHVELREPRADKSPAHAIIARRGVPELPDGTSRRIPSARDTSDRRAGLGVARTVAVTRFGYKFEIYFTDNAGKTISTVSRGQEAVAVSPGLSVMSCPPFQSIFAMS
jgi:hypothetical protein